MVSENKKPRLARITYPFSPSRTTLAHSVAASIVLLLEIMHGGESGGSSSKLLPLVLQAIEVFRSVQGHSAIAEKGLEMLTDLVEGYRSRNDPQSHRQDMARSTSFNNKSRAEMDNAMSVLENSRDEAQRKQSTKSPPKELVSPPAFAQPPAEDKRLNHSSEVAGYLHGQEQGPPVGFVQSPFQWLAAAPLPLGLGMDMNADSFTIPEFGGTDGFYDWDIGLSWMEEEGAQTAQY